MTIHPLSSSFVRNLEGGSEGNGARSALRRGLRDSLMGLSVSGLVLASTALVPASVSAQTVNLGPPPFNGALELNNTTDADYVVGGVYTNGALTILPFAASDPFLFDATLSDVLGVASFTKTGTRSLELLRAGSTHSGLTLINSSLVTTRVANALSPNSTLSLGAGATLEMNGFDQAIARLSSGAATSTVRNVSAGNVAATLTIGGGSGTEGFAGLIEETSGVISIVKSGAGSQSFTNSANSFSGGVTLLGGELRYGADGSLGTGAVTVAQAGAVINALAAGTALGNDVILDADVEVAGSDTTVWTGVVSGVGAIEKAGSGTLTLSNSANSFSGGVDLNGGLLQAGADNALGTGAIRFADSIAQLGTAGNISVSLANDIDLQAGANINGPGAGNALTLSGVISGTERIFLRAPGGGTLALTGDNSFSGGIDILTGNLGVGSDTALGTASVFFSDTSGGLEALADGLVIDNTLRLERQINVDTGANTLELSGGLIDGSGNAGGINKVGAGTLIVSGATTYTGGTTVNGGALQVDGSLGGDVELFFDTMLTGSGSVGGTVSTGEGATIAPGNSPGTLAIGGNLLLASADTLEFELADPAFVGGGINDLITVGGDLTLDGAIEIIPLTGFSFGTYTIITYDGALTDNILNVGTLPTDVGANVIVSNPGLVQLDVFFAGGEQYWDGANTVSNNLIDGGTGTWDDTALNWTNIDGDTNLPWADVIAIFTTTGGDVTVDGAKSVAGLTFEVDGYALTGDELQFNVIDPTAIDVQTGTASIDNVISGEGVTKFGDGTLELNAANTFTSLNIVDGAVQVGNDSGLGVGTVDIDDGSSLIAGTDVSLANSIILGGEGTGVTISNNGFEMILNGVISGNGPLLLDGTLDPFVGSTTLNGVNTYTLGTVITQGFVTIGADSALGNAAGGLTLDESTLRTTADITSGRSVLIQSLGSLRVDGGTTLTLNGVVSGDALFKLNEGTLVLGNAGNSQSENFISDGVLAVASDGALGQLAAMINFTPSADLIPPGAQPTLRLDAAFDTARNVNLEGDETGTIDTNGFDSTFSGTFADSSFGGRLAKDGAGQLTLTGTNTYSGGTNLNAGALRIDNDNAIGTGVLTTQDGTTFVAGIGASQTITLANDIVFDPGTTTIDLVGGSYSVNATTGGVLTNGTALTLNGTISGDGGWVSQNSGTVFINGDNSYAGGTELTNAAVFVGSGTALGTGLVTLNDFSSVQNQSGGALSLANDFLVNAVAPFGAVVGGADDLTLSGVFSGEGVLDKAGIGTVTVTGLSDFDGVLNVNDGNFIVETGAEFGGATLLTSIRNGALLGGTGTVVGNVSMADASILSPGTSPGTLTITGDLALSGTTDLQWELGQAYALGGALNDRVIVGGNLTLDGLLTVTESAGGAFTLGVYNLFSYDTLTDNDLTIQALPGGFSGVIQNNMAASQVNLIVTQPGTFIQYWDGADLIGNGAIDGGTGNWEAAFTNWTGSAIDPSAFPNPGGAPSELNTTWQPGSVGVFQGTAGTVDVVDNFSFQGLQFLVDGYTLIDGEGSLEVGTPQSFIFTDAGVTTEISTLITGAGQLLKQGAGTLVLSGNNDYAGGTLLQLGEISVGSNGALGTGALEMLDGTILSAATPNLTLANDVITNGVATILPGGTVFDGNVFTLGGVVSGAGSLLVTNEGSLRLAGVNTYAGGTELGAQTRIIVTNAASLGTGQLTMGDVSRLAAEGDVALANDILIPAFRGFFETNGNVFTLDGIISGGGTVATLGNGGNLVLNGDNTHTGGVNIGGNSTFGTVTLGSDTAAGTGLINLFGDHTLAAGADVTVANAVQTSGNGLVASNGFTFTLDGNIGGAGSISHVTAGNLVLNGDNSFTNLGINAGTVTLGSDTAAGIGFVALNSNATMAAGGDVTIANDIETTGNGLVASNGFTFTLDGNIGGAGSISHVTGGNLVLNGDNFFNNLGINAGTVTLGSDTAAGIGFVALNSNATMAAGGDVTIANDIETTGNGLVASNGFTFTLDGNIGGAGSISHVTGGTLVLNGDNFFNNLGINAGRVTLGSDTAAGVGDIALASNARMAAGGDVTIANGVQTLGNGLVESNGFTFTLNGNVDGPGSISHVTAGNLVLNGNNTFNNLGINAGTVTLGSDTAAGIGDIAIASNARLAAGADVTIANGVQTLGNGLVASNGFTFTLNGNVDGPGSISHVTAGNLVLNGNNTFNNLGINAGTVTLGSDTAAGSGFIALNSNARMAAGGDVTIANAVETTGNGLVASNGFTFTLNGSVGGAGSISHVTDGNLVLNGNNGFNNLGINRGTVTLGSDTAAGSGFIALNSNARMAAGGDVTIANAVETTGNGLVASNGFTFTLNGSVGGAGSISHVTDGNLVLNGNNGFNNLGINRGTVTLGSDTAAGSGFIALNSNARMAAGGDVTIANAVETTGNGLVASNGFTFTLNGSVGGAGSISHVTDGNLVLNGNNGFNNLGINRGTVTLGTNTAAGVGEIAINDGATLAAGSGITIANQIETTDAGIIDSGMFDFTIDGVIGGLGSITKIGTGTLFLTQDNSYSGGTTINAGAISILTAGGLGTGPLTLAGGLIFGADGIDFANDITLSGTALFDVADSATLSGILSGSGSLTKAGVGSLTLVGPNSYTGGTIITAGTLVGNSGSFGSGDIANDGSLVFDQMVDGTFGPAISGSGTVTKQGGARLTLSGISTYTGATSVTAGDLNVTGSIASSTVTVGDGASVSGTGTLGGLIVQSGATAAPGNSIGTLSVAGPVTFLAGSTYAAEVSPMGSDMIVATGPATLAGTLAIDALPGQYTFGTGYTLLTASTLNGTFDDVTGLDGFGTAFNPLVSYGGNMVRIALAPSAFETVLPGLTGNALEVARAFDRAVAGGFNPQPFFDLYTQGANTPAALTELSGEIHSAERRVALEDTRVVRDTAFDRLNSGLAALSNTQSATMGDGEAETTFWLRGAGSWGVATGDDIGQRFTTEQIGVLTGLDYATNGFKVGAGFTYTQNDIESAFGNARVKTTGGMLYAGYRTGGFSLGVGGSLAGTRTNTNRSITAPGLAQSLRSEGDGTTYQLFGELAYDLATSETTQVTPFARYAYVSHRADEFGETGGIAAVSGVRQTYDISVGQLGLRAGFDLGGGTSIVGSAAYQNVWGDRSPIANLTIDGLGQSAAIRATALAKHSAVVDATAKFRIGGNASIGIGYNGVIGDNNSDHGARATLTVGF